MLPTTNDFNPWHLNLKEGDRVVLRYMGKDPDPIPVGTCGTVTNVIDFSWTAGKPEQQICINWDNGRSLACICPPDILYPAYDQMPTTPEHDHDFRWRPVASK